MRYFDKDVGACAAGAGIGCLQTVIFREFKTEWGMIPGIGGFLPVNWQHWDSTGNLIIGAVEIGLSFLNLASPIKALLLGAGFATAVGGLVNGIFPATGLGTRARLKSPDGRAARRPLNRGALGRRPGQQSAAAFKRASIAKTPSAYVAPRPGGQIRQSPAGLRTSLTTNEVVYTPTMIKSNKILA